METSVEVSTSQRSKLSDVKEDLAWWKTEQFWVSCSNYNVAVNTIARKVFSCLQHWGLNYFSLHLGWILDAKLAVQWLFPRCKTVHRGSLQQERDALVLWVWWSQPPVCSGQRELNFFYLYSSSSGWSSHCLSQHQSVGLFENAFVVRLCFPCEILVQLLAPLAVL